MAGAVTAHAQDCDPKSFTFQDIETIETSDILKYSNLSIMQQSRSQSRETGGEGTIPIEGIPGKLSFSDAQSLAEHVLKHNDVRFSRDQKMRFARTTLSAIGADMYQACLEAQSIRVTLPSLAATSKSFDVIVRWNPAGLASDAGTVELRPIGGEVEGAARYESEIARGADTPFRIDRDLDKPLILTIIAEGRAYPTIELPPNLELRKPSIERRNGRSSQPRTAGGDRCGPDPDPKSSQEIHEAYLVSEVGSRAGPDSKSCTLCVTASANGILLKDTARIEHGTLLTPFPPVSTKMEITTSTNREVCAKFDTVGHGRVPGGPPHPRSEIDNGVLTVYEAVYP